MSVTVVLIVEDDTLLRMLTVDVVEEAGFEAIEALRPPTQTRRSACWNAARTLHFC
jgi:hypothetical protein